MTLITPITPITTPTRLLKPIMPVPTTPRKQTDFDAEDDANPITIEKPSKPDKFEKYSLKPPILNVIAPPPPLKIGFWESKLGTVAKWGIGGAALGGISTLIEPLATGILNIFGKGVKELGWVPRAGIVIGVGTAVGALIGVIPALLQRPKTPQSADYLVATTVDSDGLQQTKVLSSPSTTYINSGGGDGSSYSSRYRDDGYGYAGGSGYGGGGYYGGGYGGGGRFLEDYLVASALGNALNGGGRNYHQYYGSNPYGYGGGYGGRNTVVNNHHYYGADNDDGNNGYSTTTQTSPTAFYRPKRSSSTKGGSSSNSSGGVFKNADGSSRGMFSSNSKSSRSTPTMRTAGFSSKSYGSPPTSRSFFWGGGSRSSGRGFGSSTLKSSGGGYHGGGGHGHGSFGSGRSSGGGSKK